jgi:hypothetical protein
MDKAQNAQAAKFAGLVIVDNTDSESPGVPALGEDAMQIRIPVVMVAKEEGDHIAMVLAESPLAMELTISVSTSWAFYAFYCLGIYSAANTHIPSCSNCSCQI